MQSKERKLSQSKNKRHGDLIEVVENINQSRLSVASNLINNKSSMERE